MTPVFQIGNMWDAYEQDFDLFCLTTNSTVRKDGALVMGRGIALEAATRIPHLQMTAGQHITSLGLAGRAYYLLTLSDPQKDMAALGLFQVKRHFRDKANPQLIEGAVDSLTRWCANFRASLGFEPVVHLNFPGIGWGHLRREDVLPLLAPLPPCVTVWELPTRTPEEN